MHYIIIVILHCSVTSYDICPRGCSADCSLGAELRIPGTGQIYMYIYIYREREREREIDRYIHIHVYIYIYTHIQDINNSTRDRQLHISIHTLIHIHSASKCTTT